MVYNGNSLRETVRRMVIEYQVKKELEYYQRNKKTLDKLISKIFKRAEEALANLALENIDKPSYFEKLKAKLTAKLMVRKDKEAFFKNIQNIISYNVISAWKTEDELEEEKRKIERSRYSEEIKNYYYSQIEKRKKIAKVYEKVLDELVDIAEREGIDKVAKNFPEYFNSAIRKVFPTPEDYISFKKEQYELIEEQYNFMKKSLDKEILPYFENVISECMKIHKELYFNQVEKDVQEIYGKYTYKK